MLDYLEKYSLDRVFLAIASLAPTVGLLLTAFIYLVAVGLSIWLLWSMMSAARGREGDVLSPLNMVTFLVISLLFSMPSLMNVGQSTVFGDSSIEAYSGMAYLSESSAGGKRASAVLGAVISVIQMIGWIAVTRGTLLLRKIPSGNVSTWNVAWHFLGGVIAANCWRFAGVMANSI
ncbi:hypothetical protein GE253_23035 [Niveispirillum sp. SYP-B3756]|uniref:hypothetical protein n=1 Tax=Niveispirillum sp. SYP-B3756 TaxID=2662178 RepID=UPI0012923937|nr:hypothetical protein [Niveispirillum sp. SYP-B3756]MQP68197.1 hypothetical protein [Niveispirillum sp. SYP-B3756]